MANDSNNEILRPGAFSLSWSGGLEYGSREMTFDGVDKFYFAKGDTVNDDTQTGVGVFVLSLQNRDIEELKGVAQTLCEKDIQSGGPETHDPAATFTVVCMDDGKVAGSLGSLRLIPEKFRRKVFDVPFRLSEQARTDGRKLIKLDFTVVNVKKKSGHYFVSVKFINSGDRLIKFKTPDKWMGTTVGGRLGVGAVNKIASNGKGEEVNGSWAFGLDGQDLLNRNAFPDGAVVLKPGDSEVLEFKTSPDYKAEKGDYEFSGIAFMRIEYEGYGWGLSSQVDFKPVKARITIDHDYPSTPEEREQWEATHKKDMSSQPVKPGETFVEHGLYRAVRTSGGYRGLLLKPFRAGDVATTEPVTMPMDSELVDVNIDGPVQWVWEASAPTPIRQWSSDITDGTQQFCEPGVTCPRSGRWVARVRTSPLLQPLQYEYQLAGILTLRRGDAMPPVQGQGDAEWEWVGAARG
ncbi:hypothetical protein GCM10011400_32350 [Paraburkholderia caffeinilytica]|uniref:Uncharacterized protein n=2 Tax=Paraburkholderia caffeinilytica TaxID=1761016 RepID=A0ABQ1MQU6_9BURK|nr:hypothetical protein GCM10011400_32350 [Paraburkholderia caffeinilytica]CAB3790707.1 hypothetical protein LMG28690_03150 [Paraburkholderia caffeinilytica]